MLSHWDRSCRSNFLNCYSSWSVGRQQGSVNGSYFILLLSTAYTTWGIAGRKRRLSAARRNAWAGGMLYRDSVSLTPLIQVFRRGRGGEGGVHLLCSHWILCYMHAELGVGLAVLWGVQTINSQLLDIMIDALCSYHFSDVGVGNHVSSDLVDSFP